MKKKVILKSLVVLCLTAMSVVGTVNIAKAYTGRPYEACDLWRGSMACPLGFHCKEIKFPIPGVGLCVPFL